MAVLEEPRPGGPSDVAFLDVATMLALATVQPLVINLLQRSFIWKDAVSKSKIRENIDFEDAYETKREVSLMIITEIS